MLHYGTMEIEILNSSFENLLSPKIKIDRVYSNGYTIKELSPQPSGYSGGPILLEKKVIGILISARAILSSSYIANKLDNMVRSC